MRGKIFNSSTPVFIYLVFLTKENLIFAGFFDTAGEKK